MTSPSRERDFDSALDHALKAAEYLELDESEQQGRVIESMLAEMRKHPRRGRRKNGSRPALAARARKKIAGEVPPRRCSGWALCHAQENQFEEAFAAMQLVHEQAGKQHIDPALYLGMLVHRLGRPQEALRFLSDANRIDANCPFVTWQMGVSLIASNGDSGLAMRALLLPGRPRVGAVGEAARSCAWTEAFPEGQVVSPPAGDQPRTTRVLPHPGERPGHRQVPGAT